MTEAAPAAVEATVNKGDTAWMMVATILVMAMIVPGLALFYGGLVRAKNMLSVLTQILAVASLAMIMWVMFGYGLAFGGDAGKFVSAGKWFLAGVNADSTVATFTAVSYTHLDVYKRQLRNRADRVCLKNEHHFAPAQ